jgi:hypothetical protein
MMKRIPAPMNPADKVSRGDGVNKQMAATTIIAIAAIAPNLPNDDIPAN